MHAETHSEAEGYPIRVTLTEDRSVVIGNAETHLRAINAMREAAARAVEGDDPIGHQAAVKACGEILHFAELNQVGIDLSDAPTAQALRAYYGASHNLKATADDALNVLMCMDLLWEKLTAANGK